MENPNSYIAESISSFTHTARGNCQYKVALDFVRQKMSLFKQTEVRDDE